MSGTNYFLEDFKKSIQGSQKYERGIPIVDPHVLLPHHSHVNGLGYTLYIKDGFCWET